MSQEIRVRFAPSPTGYLHVGGVRTALFSWLFARHHKGTFVLRIEDTDLSRSTEESIDEIIASLKWLNLDWDEGPYRQTERRGIYDAKISQLLASEQAYRCYCSPQMLEDKKKEALKTGKKPKYDGTCRSLKIEPKDTPFVVRFKTPKTGSVIIHDLLRGNINFNLEEIDDLILCRSDGSPTYNFVVVVDDSEMGITHVLRGDDHLSNTPRQALLFDALDYKRPQFAHISMIMGEDKTRLSKRHGAVYALAYKKQGILPEALVNYLARLGWSHGDQEIFTVDEMIQFFSLETITTSAAVFNPDKLIWVNEQYIQNSVDATLADLLSDYLVQENIVSKDKIPSIETIEAIIPHLKKRSKTLVEMAHKSEFYFVDELNYDAQATEKFFIPESKNLLHKLASKIENTDEWNHDVIETVLKELVAEENIKLGKIAQPVRVALTGKKESPGIYDVIELLGKERTLSRLIKAQDMISTK